MSINDAEAAASRRYGVITREMALQFGLTRRQIDMLLSSGRWIRIRSGVYRVAAVASSWEQAALGAVSAAGHRAAASHLTAATVWEMSSVRDLHVTVPPTRRPRLAGVRVHRRHLADHEVTTHRGIPVTTPVITVLDVASVASASELERCIDRGVARGLLSVARLGAAVAAAIGSDRRGGTKAVRLALASRLDGDERHRTVLESRMGRACRLAGLPTPTPEYWVLDDRYRVDFAWPQWLLAVEVDGYESHSSLAAFRNDRRRQNDLVAAGWTVLRFTWADLASRPVQVAREIAAVISRLRGAFVDA